jgi:hypothetical protein
LLVLLKSHTNIDIFFDPPLASAGPLHRVRKLEQADCNQPLSTVNNEVQ